MRSAWSGSSSNDGDGGDNSSIPKMPSAYETAANQENYRVAEVQLASCTQHNCAAVLCSTSGKIGRNGRSAAVGATLFWLTCPYVNAMVARLERQGAISALQKLVNNNPIVGSRHVASHTRYEERARALLNAERWTFFETHFISVQESSGCRKYGNAAVSHATDLKCLHALVAQSLCGSPNIIGDAIMQYIVHLSKKIEHLCGRLSAVSDSKESRNNEKNDEDANGTYVAEKDTLDDVSALVTFVENCAVNNVSKGEVTSPVVKADDLCSAACTVFAFLEGRPPRHRKKHRIN